MNNQNLTPIKMQKADYFRLPANCRVQADGPMVLSIVHGRETFVPVEIIEFH